MRGLIFTIIAGTQAIGMEDFQQQLQQLEKQKSVTDLYCAFRSKFQTEENQEIEQMIQEIEAGDCSDTNLMTKVNYKIATQQHRFARAYKMDGGELPAMFEQFDW